MDILIKNIAKNRHSGWCIFELKRKGYPEMSMVKGVFYNPAQNACYWDDCVAYPDYTCEIVESSTTQKTKL